MQKSELKIDCIVEDAANHGDSKKNDASQPHGHIQQEAICDRAIVSKILIITAGYWEIKCRGPRKKPTQTGGSA